MKDENKTPAPEISDEDLKEMDKIANDILDGKGSGTHLETELVKAYIEKSDIKKSFEILKKIKYEKFKKRNYRMDNQKKEVLISDPYEINSYCNIKYIKFTDETLHPEYYELNYNNYNGWYHVTSDDTAMIEVLNDLFLLNKDLARDLKESEIIDFLNNAETTKKMIFDKATKNTVEHNETLIERVKISKNRFNSVSDGEELRNRELGLLLIDLFQIVEKQDVPDTKYYLNTNLNCYEPIDKNIGDNMILDIFYDNIATYDHLQKGLKYSKLKVKPTYNIVKFNNCLFSMEDFNILDNHNPLLPAVFCNYNYINEIPYKKVIDPETGETITVLANSNHQLAQDYLTLTFGDDEDAFLEVLGYLFVSGNPKEIIIILTGLAGAGKSTTSKIIRGIIPSIQKSLDKIKKSFGTSDFEGKQVVIIPDTEKQKADDIKSLIAGEGLYIEQKFKDDQEINDNEVQKFMLVGNNIPDVKNDLAMLDKMAIFHHKHRYRYTDNDIAKFHEKFLANNEAVEYLISRSIKAYSDKVKSGNKFKILSKTKEYLRINTVEGAVLSALEDILKVDYNAGSDEDLVYTTDLNNCIKAWEFKNKVTIEKTKSGNIKNLLNRIKEFIGDPEYKGAEVDSEYNKRYYPNLIYKEYDRDSEGKTITTKDHFIQIYLDNLYEEK